MTAAGPYSKRRHDRNMSSGAGRVAPRSTSKRRCHLCDKAIAVGVVLLTLAAASSCGYAAHTALRDSAQATPAAVAVPAPTPAPDSAPHPDFATVSTLMNDAIAASTVPGGVVVIGHGGKVVFHQAYGSRKLAGEPGLDGSPAPAEPMTEDTIFDLASLTKCPRHGDRGHAAIRTRQGSVRRSRAQVSA